MILAALTRTDALTNPALWLLIGFIALLAGIALWMDRAESKEWRERLHRIDRIRNGERP